MIRIRSMMWVGAAIGALAACGMQPLQQPEAPAPETRAPFALVLHGGAGTIERGSMTAEVEAAYRATLSDALRAGHGVLAAGGSSLDAIEASIHILEDSPLFNAGRGAVFTNDGRNEMDASIMDGATLQAGAVAGVSRIRHPISLARLVMEKSVHVMLAGAGAEAFALEQGMDTVAPSWFFTQRRWDDLQRARAAAGEPRLERPAQSSLEGGAVSPDHKFGTVGVVALDRAGRLAAGTSTGGMTNKRWGRIGDAPIIGAGTYANSSCAVSATGHGEYFIRNNVAADICARVVYLHESIDEAAGYVVMDRLVERGGDGGVIAMDSLGNWAMPFNSAGMYRGVIGVDGVPRVWIYGSE